jgi:DNA-binding response OmpR family regulator
MRVLIAADSTLSELIAAILAQITLSVMSVNPDFQSDKILNAIRKGDIDLVILTNSALSPCEIPWLVGQIKSEYPKMRIMTLSGWTTPEWEATLANAGSNIFMKLPFKIKDMQAAVRLVQAQMNLTD